MNSPEADASIYARIGEIAYHLPDRMVDNRELATLYPGWTATKILEKTGVATRHIAATDETAADLAFHAAIKLFGGGVDRAEIDVLIFCTQTPDYFLPSSSCVLQHRLGLRRDCGAFDVGLGCSGFVYCLAVAKGLIESGQATTVLVLTADTYSKLINPLDKSVRTIFSDAAAATVVRASRAKTPSIARCLMGTDGRGADKLIVATGAFREQRTAASGVVEADESGNSRSRDNLFMDGGDVLAFSLREIPPVVERLLRMNGATLDDIDFLVLHQGSRFMLEAVRRKLGADPAKFVIDLEETGNTVSSTLPIACARLMRQWGQGAPEATVMLVGFGVGYSWGATIARIGSTTGRITDA